MLDFNTNGNEKQKEVSKLWNDKETIDIVYGGSKASGKTFLGVNLIFGDAFTYPGTNYFIARNTQEALRKHTMKSIMEVFKIWGIPEDSWNFNHKDHEFRLYNGSTVLLMDMKMLPRDPTFSRFGGMQFNRGFIEEAGEIVHETAKNNLLASIGRYQGKNELYGMHPKLLQTCNPMKNYLYREYYKPFKEGTLNKGREYGQYRRFVQALPSDNKSLDPEYLKTLEANLSESEKERYLRGNWEYDDDPTVLIGYDNILDIFKDEQPEIRGVKRVTADIARLGPDRIVIIGWDGFVGTVKDYKKKLITDTTSLVEATRILHGATKANVLVDADGIGSGVQDFGGYSGFRNNARPLPDPKKPYNALGKIEVENYDNMKSQCGFRMAERINQGGIKLICDDAEIEELIIKELEQVKAKELDTDMKKGLTPKDVMKQALGRSPDFWDAILMREWFELSGRRMSIRTKTGGSTKKSSYSSRKDPYFYPELLAQNEERNSA